MATNMLQKVDAAKQEVIRASYDMKKTLQAQSLANLEEKKHNLLWDLQ
jgi:hypothetical protein